MSASEDTIDIPYLRHLKWDETVVTSGDRETPTLLYVIRGPKNDSLRNPRRKWQIFSVSPIHLQ